MAMAETPVLSNPQLTASRGALRVVLFGRTDAGKSSLLGALLQAAQTQEHLLKGHLTDLSERLSELQRRVYEETPQETLEEIVPYPITYEPFAQPGVSPGRLEAVLIDCDGRVANQLLAHPRSPDPRDGQLARALVRADAVVLAIDASASGVQVDADFAEFERFLGLLEHSRGQHTEIGGMPVYLVLTKCDLLAQAKDSIADWIERIEERKRQVDARFKAFLSRQRHPSAAFGRIDLHLWATAIKRPELDGSPARPRDPFGVAELFRQCLEAGRLFRKRRERSSRRLFGVAIASVGLLAVIGLAVALLLISRQEPPVGALETQIDGFRTREREESPAQRHRQVQKDIGQLEEWRRDPGFADLPTEKQEFVLSRLAELEAYRTYANQVRQIDPREVRTESQLRDCELRLAQITAPASYREEWAQTDAGREYADWLEDVAVIRSAVPKVEAWYQKLTEEGKQVLENVTGPNLPARAKKVLDEAQSPPFPEKDPDKLLPGAKRTTYAHVLHWLNVEKARRQWDEVKKKLEPAARLEGT
jgi:hypothetical protein